MIHVDRAPEPRVLTLNAAVWTTTLLQAIAGGVTIAQRRKAEGRYRQRSVKDTLVAMFDGKCAYCESKITHIDYGAIEHYRPKATYPQHTYDWDNLLLACSICNGPSNKGDHFPEQPEGGPILNPCNDDPVDHLEFVFDRVAKVATVSPKTRRGELTVDLLGLNRSELRTHRSQQIKRVVFVVDRAQNDPEAQALVQEMRSAQSEYAAFARVL